MRLTVIQTWCDPCAADDVQTIAEHAAIIQLDGSKPRRLDLCPAHFDSQLAPLQPVLDAFGAPPDNSPTAPPAAKRSPSYGGPDPGVCPFCHGDVKYLTMHMKGAHDFRTAEHVATETDADGATLYVCPDESCRMLRASPAALSMHYRAEHGQILAHMLAARAATPKRSRPRKSST